MTCNDVLKYNIYGGGNLDVYTLEELSEKIKIPVETLRKYLRTGKLKGAKIGKHWRVTDEQLKEFLDENTTYKK